MRIQSGEYNKNMQNLTILNSKEIRKIHELLNSQFGYNKELDFAFLQSNRNRLYIVNRDISKIDLKKLRVNSVGLYFGETYDSKIRLSIEGSQLIGKDCDKNVLELDEKESRNWLKGFDIEKEALDQEFVLLKHKSDFLGCGKAAKGRIFNFVPKNRRLKSSD